MTFKPWSEMTDEEQSPYSSTGPVRGFPNSQEARKLLDEASDTAPVLSEADASKARGKYLKKSNQELGKLNAAQVPSNLGFGKPGEAGTDKEDNTGKDEEVEGFQIVRPADPEKVDRRQAAQGEEGSSDPRDFPTLEDHWVVVNPIPTKADFPPYTNNDVTRLPKEGESFIDNGPKYAYKPQPDNISMTRQQIEEAAALGEPKPWHPVPEDEAFKEPGYPEEIEKEEPKKNRRQR